ncbi:hypothetical protein EDB85DRAFT_2215260 [Lactarius pseudohatsudake]|nr:hypothetical protein EDB85DRAFT_2215260 [Lactarius pseudohatsudake]
MVLRNVAGRRGGVLACRESADGGVLRSELSGMAGQGGVVRRRGAVWRVSGGKVLRAVLGRHGDGLAVEVLRAVLRRRGGLAVARCWAEMNGGGERARGGGNGLQRPGVAGWRWWRAASHVGVACSGRDEWRWRACMRGDNGLQRSVSSPPACAPTSTPHPASPDSPFQASLPFPLVAIAAPSSTRVISTRPRSSTLPQHGLQHPATTAPTLYATSRPPTHHHATPIRHATPRYCQLAMLPQHDAQHPTDRLNAARKAQPPLTPTPPDMAHNTPPPANSPPPRPNMARQDPATSRKTPPCHARPRHITQDPADPPRRLNTARKAATTNPHATPTRN